MMQSMFTSGSTKLVKNLNKHHVLNLVRMHTGVTARDISKITKLQMSTVLYTLRSLKEDGLLKEIGYGNSTLHGGKPPIVWDIAGEYGYVIGIGLISKEVRVVLMDFNEKVLYKKNFAVKKYKDAKDLTDQLVSIIKFIIKENKISSERVLGVGVGFSGLVDFSRGVVTKATGFHFENVPLKEMLEKEFDFKIEIENNANAGALGIKWLHEEAKTIPNILYLTVHKVFGAMGVGLIIDHKLFHGANFSAGEIGSFLRINNWKKILKSAKNKVADYKVLEAYNKHKDEVIDIPTVIKLAKTKNESAIFILREVGKEISRQLVFQIDLLDPDVIYMGGGMCDAQEFIDPIIKERVPAQVIANSSKATPIKYSPFGMYSVAMGGAALIFQFIFGKSENC
ncbi:MAG: transcriptional regulator [Melioribacteraceae bacterium]|nr:transcriptional regulator [Melioribacteraceae bacterium]